MTDIFLRVFEMSLYGSIAILLTIIVCLILRNKSKRLIFILWAAVAIRLLLPINIESKMSIFNLFASRMLLTNQEISVSDELESLPDSNVNSSVLKEKNLGAASDKTANAEPEVVLNNSELRSDTTHYSPSDADKLNATSKVNADFYASKWMHRL